MTSLQSDRPVGEQPGASRDAAISALVQRLQQRCGGAICATEIQAIVRTCLDDLAGSPVTALPELVERLAVQRVLLRLRSDPPAAGAPGRPG